MRVALVHPKAPEERVSREMRAGTYSNQKPDRRPLTDRPFRAF